MLVIVASHRPLGRRLAMDRHLTALGYEPRWVDAQTTGPVKNRIRATMILASQIAAQHDQPVTVLQDDIRLNGSLPDLDGPLIVWWPPQSESHWCPRAYTAIPTVHNTITTTWQTSRLGTCQAWAPLCQREATVHPYISHGQSPHP